MSSPDSTVEPAPTVLIVDDDPGAHLLLGTALEIAGFHVTSAANGAAAIASFRAHPVDCIILDVVMPGMNGFDTCTALRALPHCHHVPILMQTSLDDMDSVNRAYKAGATDFSSKGVNPMLLAQRVKFLVRTKRTQDQLVASEARVRYLAYYDTLTALPNRQRLKQLLVDQVEWATLRQSGVATLMLDIDNFSRINDTQGPAAGDAVLKEVADRLQHCLRECDRSMFDAVATATAGVIKDCVARTGGDEFGLVLPGVCTAEAADSVARRVQIALARPFVIGGQEYPLSASSRWSPRTPRTSSTMPTRPCTTRKRSTWEECSFSRNPSRRAPPSACRSSRICVKRSSGRSSCCIISRGCRSRPCRSRPSKRCCAGPIRSVVWCRRTSLSPFPSKAA
jgi:PleD family two-component response regulator